MIMRIARLSKSERGAAAVEFAILLPVLILLIIGLIEFGLLYHDYLAVTHAAREGARMAAVNRFGQFDAVGSSGLNGATATMSYPSGSASGNPVMVTVAYDHALLTGYLQTIGIPSVFHLHSEAVMRLEQPGIP